MTKVTSPNSRQKIQDLEERIKSYESKTVTSPHSPIKAAAAYDYRIWAIIASYQKAWCYCRIIMI